MALTFSIITATLGPGSDLDRTVRAIDSLDYPAIEHIIVSATELGQQCAGAPANVRRRLLTCPPAGVYDAINRGIALATGDIIALVNGGDVPAGDRVLEAVASVFADPTVDYISGAVEVVDSRGVVVRRFAPVALSMELLEQGIAPAHPSLFIRAAAARSIGPYRPEFTTAGDFDMWVRLALRPDLKGVTTHYVLNRMSSGGLSQRWSSRLWTNPRQKLAILRRNGLRANPLRLLKRYTRLLIEFSSRR